MPRRSSRTRPSGKAQKATDAALSPRALLGFALADVTRLLRSIYDVRLSAEGLSGASWRVLAYLYRDDGLSQAKLAEMLEISRPAIGQMIDRLEAANFVERRADSADRGSWKVFLSPKSHSSLESYLAVSNAIEEECLSVFSEAEFAQLTALVGRLRAHLLGLQGAPAARGDRTGS